MSRDCVFLVGVTERVIHYSWLARQIQPSPSEAPIIRPPPEPLPHSKKKITLKWISFSVAGQTDDPGLNQRAVSSSYWIVLHTKKSDLSNPGFFKKLCPMH
ncbi:unnamed protein product [Cuscuta epithymum]|uniref:Uncharacterized protein n=1 Tax=Cuscuta epithymum TaxID=186058 RepID=A0AAV0C5Q5_9ASTE|nr:unnamed protein product [Cuscuta epithymum]